MQNEQVVAGGGGGGGGGTIELVPEPQKPTQALQGDSRDAGNDNLHRLHTIQRPARAVSLSKRQHNDESEGEVHHHKYERPLPTFHTKVFLREDVLQHLPPLDVTPYRAGKFLYTLFILTYICILLAFSAVLWQDNVQWSRDYEWTYDNWLKGVITDVQVRDANSACAQGWEDFFNYTFPGTKEWCWCSGSQSNEYSVGKCNENDACEGQQMPETGAQKLSVWATQSAPHTPYRLCVERQENVNFVTAAITSERCLSSHRRCGEGKNAFCMPRTNSKCPITAIQIAPSPSFAPDIAIPLPDGATHVYASSTVNALPVSELQVSEAQGVCVKRDYLNTSPGRPENDVLKSPKKQCDQDDRWRATGGRLDEQTFFAVNDFEDAAARAMPSLFAPSPNYEYQNFYRSYVPFAFECRDKYLHKLVYSGDDFESLREKKLVLIVFACLMALTLATLENYTTYIAQNFYGFTVSQEVLEYKTGLWRIARVAIMMKFIIQACFGIALFIILVLVNQYASFLDDVMAASCVDGATLPVVQQMRSQLSNRALWVMGGFWIVFWTAEIHMVYFYFTRLCPHRLRPAQELRRIVKE